MINKKFIVGITAAIIIASVAGLYFCFFSKTQEKSHPTIVKSPKQIKNVATVKNIQPEIKQKTIDLYTSSHYNIPLYSVLEISKLSQNMKKSVDKIIEDGQGVYLLNFNKQTSKVFIIPQNLTDPNEIYARHGLECIELSENDGKIEQNKISIGYTGDSGEIVNAVSGVNTDDDSWEIDESSEMPRPLKHTRYDSDKNIVFVEQWNYSDNAPIKYEMTNSEGTPISVYKETPIKDSEYTHEHIFYDANGKTIMSVSAAYDGQNVVRFNYYNADNTENNINIMDEYTDGLKTSEKIYDGNYKLLNSLEAKYDGDKRINISTKE